MARLRTHNRRRARRASRRSFAQRFLRDLHAAWQEHGEEAIKRAMFIDPVAVLGIIARLAPAAVSVEPAEGMSDERLTEMLDFADKLAKQKKPDNSA